MTKKKYVAQISPQISKADEIKLNNQFKNIASGFHISMKSAVKIGSAIAGGALVVAWWNHQKKAIDEVNNSFNEYLANTDRLGTIANDLQANAGDFALTDVALSTYGLSQEDRDKLYMGVKQSYAENKIIQQGGNLLGSLIDIQKQYQLALQNKDIKMQDFIKNIVGLRGQKATEFLGGDLELQINKLKKDFSTEEINTAINRGGNLEQLQAESLARQQLKGIIQISKISQQAGEGIIASQEQYNLAVKQGILDQYGNYENMMNITLAKEKVTRNLLQFFDKLLDPILLKVGQTATSGASFFAEILSVVLKELFTMSKSAIISYIQNILKAVGLDVFFKKNKTPMTETDKKSMSINPIGTLTKPILDKIYK